MSDRMLDKRARRRSSMRGVGHLFNSRANIENNQQNLTSASQARFNEPKLGEQCRFENEHQKQLEEAEESHPMAKHRSADLNLRLAGNCSITSSTSLTITKGDALTGNGRPTCWMWRQDRNKRKNGAANGRSKSIRSEQFGLAGAIFASPTDRSSQTGRPTLLALLGVALLLIALASPSLAGFRSSPSSAGEQDKQLQLLRSVNVELSRRSERLQRDTSPSPAASSESAGGEGSTSLARPTCGYPGSPAHASVTFNTSQVTAGTAASYTCDNGYELLGPPRRICQANGTWSPIGIPFCVLNVGLGKAAMQSSTAGHGSAQKAVDGSTSPYFQASTCTMTDVESNPWWYVNLLEPYLVQIVRIDFGTACCANRQKATIAVRVGNNRPDLGNNPLCNRYHGFIEEGKPLFLPCTRPAPGAFVSIHLESPSGSALSICETFIYTDHALSIEQCPSFRDQPLGSTATYNGKCYLFHNNQALNFEGARKYCESRGGTLVDETSPALQGFLSWELYRRHRNDQLMGQYWLGAVKDPRNAQNWKWINGKDVQISFWNSLASQGNCSRFDGSKGWLWSDTDCNLNLNFICQYRPLSCGKPEKPTNSTLITKNIDNGTVIEYQCAPGNMLMGPKSRACLPTGFFSEFAPKCKYLDCQFPAMIPNGDYKLLNGTTSYQSVVNYYCNEGYQIYGKSTLACDVDERWNGPPPRCEPFLCPAPVPPSNGYVTVTSNITIPGTQATYDCRPGYELVGDRLLTCSQSGSWDNSFPYCRERRPSLQPHTLQIGVSTPATPTGTSTPTYGSTTSSSTTTGAPKLASRVQPPARPSVQFPASSPFASSRLNPASTSIQPPAPPSVPTIPASTSSSPAASLNGLAGQFTAAQNNQFSSTQQPSLATGAGTVPGGAAATGAGTGTAMATATVPAEQPNETFQQTRKTSQASSSSVSQFALPPLGSPSSSSPSPLDLSPLTSLSAIGSSSTPTTAASTTQQASRFRPSAANQQILSSFATNAQQQQQSLINNRQQQSAINNASPISSNKFAFSSNSNQQPATSSQVSYDSTPVAATNSISVHSSSQQQSVSSVIGSTPTSTMASVPIITGSPGNHQSNVLASFSPPVRSHNTLASAKYSLDGIIAVAIFGGFIFLGAIITIIVIIIRRRKSSHSSAIDAQTISTYDSNGDHNGLYRNYQQAWENLRFATPNSQPKSSGGAGGVSLMSGHLNGPPVVGLKNFGSPQVAMMAHPTGYLHANALQGHHNLAMNASGSSSSQSSSLGGVAAGADPLLRGHQVHAHAIMQHHNQQQQQLRLSTRRHPHQRDQQDEEEEEDDRQQVEEEEDEQGVLSVDEIASYHRDSANLSNEQHRLQRSHQQLAGEGFRDSNELTINADTVASAAGRRRIYSTNSIGRSAARNQLAASSNRLSTNLSTSGDHHNRVHQSGHAHHHHHHHHLGCSPSSGSQHQRLVPSSTPSTSTRSSRASPPSDDQSLDQLAYGNNWHPNGSGGDGGPAHLHDSGDSSSGGHNRSVGSGASILGNGGRANLRY